MESSSLQSRGSCFWPVAWLEERGFLCQLGRGGTLGAVCPVFSGCCASCAVPAKSTGACWHGAVGSCLRVPAAASCPLQLGSLRVPSVLLGAPECHTSLWRRPFTLTVPGMVSVEVHAVSL